MTIRIAGGVWTQCRIYESYSSGLRPSPGATGHMRECWSYAPRQQRQARHQQPETTPDGSQSGHSRQPNRSVPCLDLTGINRRPTQGMAQQPAMAGGVTR